MHRFIIPLFLVFSLCGCTTLYPEYTPEFQEEIVANRDRLIEELAQRDPPSRLMFGMMVAKVRCDAFWQDLEKYRTTGDILLANLQHLTSTIAPVLQAGPGGGVNERTVATTIWAIGVASEFVSNQNDLAFLAIDKYRSALREKWDSKQRIYYSENKAYAEQIQAGAQRFGRDYIWPRLIADEVNFRIYEYARLCTRPELLMTFDQLLTDSRIVPNDTPPPGAVTSSRSFSAPRRSRDLPGFEVVR
jgi:hypothetical protein